MPQTALVERACGFYGDVHLTPRGGIPRVGVEQRDSVIAPVAGGWPEVVQIDMTTGRR